MPVKPKPALTANHIRYGPGEVLSVHSLDTGNLAAVVRFPDGTERCIRLDQQYWLSKIDALKPTPPKPPKRVRKKAVAVKAEPTEVAA
jgi:hypothetical protein